MKGRHFAEMLFLAALWGGSFIFLRSAAPDFGPIALAFVRVLAAALCLLPLAALKGQMGDLKRHWKPIFICGVLSCGLPFAMVAYALLSLGSGLSSIFNAATPLWGAVIAWAWLGDRLSGSRIVGLMIGFAGVVGLAWSKASFGSGDEVHSSGLAIIALLCSTLFYAIGVSFTKRYLNGVAPIAVAAGSQVGAALFLALPAIIWWPQTLPSAQAWGAAALLAVASTALAYVLFFRLIGSVGAANATATTFLVPAFAVLWAWLVFNEVLTTRMVIGCVVIISGTVLATGLLKFGPQGRAGDASAS